jgi:hypothetical protein
MNSYGISGLEMNEKLHYDQSAVTTKGLGITAGSHMESDKSQY